MIDGPFYMYGEDQSFGHRFDDPPLVQLINYQGEVVQPAEVVHMAGSVRIMLFAGTNQVGLNVWLYG